MGVSEIQNTAALDKWKHQKGYLAGLSLRALRNPVCCEPVGMKSTFSV